MWVGSCVHVSVCNVSVCERGSVFIGRNAMLFS